MRLRVADQHSQFWLILARFVDYYSLFWGPGVISTINEPWGAFTCWSITLAVWPILARFLDYYSLFRVPEAISIVVEPQGALTYRSSTLTDLADSGPFRGLLLTVFGAPELFSL